MPEYSYIAKSLKGEEKKGVSEARDVHELSKKLHEQGFVLIKAEIEKKSRNTGLEISLPFAGGVSLSERMFFCKKPESNDYSWASIAKSHRHSIRSGQE